MVNKTIIKCLELLDFGSSVSIRLVKLTGKNSHPVHPKHLINQELWYKKYLEKKDLVLDLGCGNGLSSLKIAPYVKQVIGMDISKESIKIAKLSTKNFKNVSFMRGDANNKLPFGSKVFNKVICSDVLEHLNNRDLAILEIKRVLKKGGLLLLVTDNPETPWKKMKKTAGVFYYADLDHKYEYPKKIILKKLKEKGFKVLSLELSSIDTPFRGLIDLVGGISLTVYKKIKELQLKELIRHPKRSAGFRIVAENL